MTSKRIAQTNQQQKSETAKASGILQRAGVRFVSDVGGKLDEQEAMRLSNSAFPKDLSQVPISTATTPQQIIVKQIVSPVVQRMGRRIDYQEDMVVLDDISSYREDNHVRDGRNVAVFYYPYPGTKTVRASGNGQHSEFNIDQALTQPQRDQVNRIHSEFKPCNDGPGGGCETMIQQNYSNLNDNQITYWWEYGEEYEKVAGRAHKKDEHSWGKNIAVLSD